MPMKLNQCFLLYENDFKCFAAIFWQALKEMRIFLKRHSLDLKILSVNLSQGSVVTFIGHENTNIKPPMTSTLQRIFFRLTEEKYIMCLILFLFMMGDLALCGTITKIAYRRMEEKQSQKRYFRKLVFIPVLLISKKASQKCYFRKVV